MNFYRISKSQFEITLLWEIMLSWLFA